jgi:hypothetical protein
MNEPNHDGPTFPLSGGIVALAIAMVLYLTIETPFQDARPENPRFSTSSARSTELVQARLWEDPFAAVARHSAKGAAPAKKPPNCSGHSLTDLTAQIEELKDRNSIVEVVVMPVMVFGGPYPQNQEGRIRTRHAVLSALGRLSYAPRDEEHINYFKPCDADDTPCLPEIVPYEWFIRADPQHSHSAVLLLWLDDDHFQEKPWKKLAYLVDKIKEEFEPCPYNIRFAVQGPAGSTVLREMVRNAIKIDAGNEDLTALKGVEIYSPKATVAENYLGLVGSLGDICNLLLKDEEGHGGFYRTIGTDTELAESLISEIKRRISPKWQNPYPPHIALISEWDTFYGRTFPEAFRKSLENAYPLSFKEEINTRLHRVTYLRGIDGKGPRIALEQKDKAVDGKGSDRADKNGIERPVGAGQLDYLRRLADSLERESEQIAAIGVVGSDVYDKLLVLQALRDRFPGKIFFTTDLDANLLHPQEREWTRNLIVASHFGLEAHPRWQEGVPPFRGSYQTAQFFSTKLALDALHGLPPVPSHTDWQAQIDALRGAPRIFEIGRSGAFDLSVNGADYCSANDCATNDNQSSESLISTVYRCAVKRFRMALDQSFNESQLDLHPEREDLAITGAAAFTKRLNIDISRNNIIVAAAKATANELAGFVAAVWSALHFNFKKLDGYWYHTVFLLILIFLLLYRRISSRTSSDYLIDTIFLVVGLISGGILYLLIIAQGEAGEPFAWFEGISIWPTAYLRLFAALLALYFLIRAWCNLTENINTLDEVYFQPRRYRADLRDQDSQASSHGEVVLDGGALKRWQSYRDHKATVFASLRHPLGTIRGWVQSRLRGEVRQLLGEGVRTLWQLIRRSPVFLWHFFGWFFWSHPRYRYPPKPPQGTSDFEEQRLVSLWIEYHEQNRLWRRFLRVLLLTTVFVLLVSKAAFVTFSSTHTPARGALSFFTHLFIIKWLVAPLLTFLIFWTVDATKRAVWLVKELCKGDTRWPAATREHFARRFNIDREYVGPWIDIQFIAEHTTVIHKLVYLPVVVIFVLILSRATYFDDWHFSIPLVIVLGLLLAYCIYNAIILRRAAEYARLSALETLHEGMIKAAGISQEKPQQSSQEKARPKVMLEQLKLLVDEVDRIRQGAFLPLPQQPWLRAIVLLLGGGSGLAYLQYFVWSR